MNPEIIDKLQYSYAGQNDSYPLPFLLKDSFGLISEFFKQNSNNKLCLVFPSKEYVAQWISYPLALELLSEEFKKNKKDIYEAYKLYKPTQKLLLNNVAVVEWLRGDEKNLTFKTKGITIKKRPWENTDGDLITINSHRINNLRPAPESRKALSSRNTVYENLSPQSKLPIDLLLSINSNGNFIFQKESICLISKHCAFENSISDIYLNNFLFEDYFKTSKIDENGIADGNSPLLLSNNFLNLAMYVTLSTSVIKIVIDGFAAIQERETDFSDIDVKNIPTVLITDLSEIEKFENIENYGFEFFNFTKENLKLNNSGNQSPFHSLEQKLKKYISFNLIKEICQNDELETTIQEIHSIEKDISNNDLNSLKISLVQLVNLVSRIAHIPTPDEISNFNLKITSIESLFLRCKTWLGDSAPPIEASLSLLKSVIEKFTLTPTEKCVRLKALINKNHYDYIICPTEEEAKTLNDYFLTAIYTRYPQVISVADVNDNLLSDAPQKAILTGWAKSNNINRILSSFLFSELTVLFYQFENKYYDSLQRRNRKYNNYIKPTINSSGFRLEIDSIKRKGFDDLYSGNDIVDASSEGSLDILEFELKLDNAEYSKYLSKDNLIESIKAKRIDFENNLFIYSSESHKLLVINDLLEKKDKKANLHRRKVEALKNGDIIVLINTDRDILVELVEKKTNSKELASVKQWTELWKNLLKEYYSSIDNNFQRLVDDLRKNHCKKHEVTIRTWLVDENKIGPDDDADLISIALLTGSNLLNDNIKTVREAIKKMKGWRMRASDFITDKIKSQIHKFADNSVINKKISVEGLGSVFVLKVIEVSNEFENINIRYVNRLLQKELI
jgi:hypothetical protein